jgi:peptidyl-prolyl cis-trans isomerase SurA
MRTKLCIVGLMVAAITAAAGQVASHAPTIAKAPTVTKTAPAPEPVQTFAVKPVARVNGATLTDIDLVREMFTMFPYAKQHNGIPKDLEPEMRRGALEMIIFQELLYQDAKRRNVTIPDAELKRAEQEFRKQFATKAEYQQFLQVEAGGSATVMREKIRRSLLVEKMLRTEVRLKAIPSAAAVRAYYDKNPKEFMHGETVHIQSISIMPPKASSKEVLAEAKRRADDALKAAKATNSFETFGLLAEKTSDDDFHVNMGDHKERPAEQLPPSIVALARKMKPGQISDVIQMEGNYTIFRLVAYTPAGKTPFVKAKAQIFTNLQKAKTEQIRTALNKNLQKNAKIERL